MQTIKPIWTEDYKILLNHTYANRKARLSTYLAFFQESAWHHADNMGFGFENIEDTGLLWVLVKLHLYVNEFVGWGETVSTKTWPVGMEKILARRDFTISRPDGDKLAAGASWWLVLEKSTRRPASTDIVKRHLHLATPVHAVEAKPDRISLPGNMQLIGNHLVNYSEIDLHQHVNNTFYPEWALNAMGSEWIGSHRVKSFTIDFINEALENDLIELFANESQCETVYFNGVRTTDGKEIFRIKLCCQAV